MPTKSPATDRADRNIRWVINRNIRWVIKRDHQTRRALSLDDAAAPQDYGPPA